MVLGNHVLYVIEMDFLRKRFFCPKNGPYIGFVKFTGKFSDCFFLNFLYKESLYNLLYSCTNPILGKNLVPEIWAKMLSNIGLGVVKNACGLSDLRTLKLAISRRNQWNKLIFWFVDKNSGKLKVTLVIFGLCWSKMGLAF